MFTYILFLAPAFLLSLWASYKTKHTFKKYSHQHSSKGLTGSQAARAMLDAKGIYNVTIERVGGSLTDHYDPSNRTLRLSDDVYSSTSLSAVGVACHEAGHAIQHAENYAFLTMRSKMVPMVGFGTNAAFILFFIGFFLKPLMYVAIAFFAIAFLFSVVTLPVEYDASARAKKAMVGAGLLSESEVIPAGKVLNAAFLTYLAAAVMSLSELLYYLMQSGLLGDDD